MSASERCGAVQRGAARNFDLVACVVDSVVSLYVAKRERDEKRCECFTHLTV